MSRRALRVLKGMRKSRPGREGGQSLCHLMGECERELSSSSDHDLFIVIIRRQGKRVTCLIRVVGLMQVLPLFFATYEMQGTPYIFTVRARGIRTNQHLCQLSLSQGILGVAFCTLVWMTLDVRMLLLTLNI